MGSCSSCSSCSSCPWCSRAESTDTAVEAAGMVAGAGCAEGPVKVVVFGTEEKTWTIELCDTEEQFQSITVLQLKEKFKERLIAEDPTRSCFTGLRLSFKDKKLDKDSMLLSGRGIQHMSVIHIMPNINSDSCPSDSKEVIPDF